MLAYDREAAHAGELMCTGKNRPMDEEELHFIDAVEAQQREKDRAAREEEEAALDVFQQVRWGGRHWQQSVHSPSHMHMRGERSSGLQRHQFRMREASAESICMHGKGWQCMKWCVDAAAGGEGGGGAAGKGWGGCRAASAAGARTGSRWQGQQAGGQAAQAEACRAAGAGEACGQSRQRREAGFQQSRAGPWGQEGEG